MKTVTAEKPKLRGYFHQEAFFIALGASMLLVAKSTTGRDLLAALIYSFGLLLMFASSATYHRFHWPPKQRTWLQRLDHSAIFILIAGTTTPIAMLALPAHEGRQLLIVIWTAAAAGILQSSIWVTAPKWLMAALCVATGWLSLPYLSDFKASLSHAQLNCVIAGGVIYSLGALVYALKRPNFRPAIFGYHELFHLFTIVAAAFHFSVIYQLVR